MPRRSPRLSHSSTPVKGFNGAAVGIEDHPQIIDVQQVSTRVGHASSPDFGVHDIPDAVTQEIEA